MVTAVGDDALGRDAAAFLEGKGIGTALVGRAVCGAPTGQVPVTIDPATGEPSFDTSLLESSAMNAIGLGEGACAPPPPPPQPKPYNNNTPAWTFYTSRDLTLGSGGQRCRRTLAGRSSSTSASR